MPRCLEATVALPVAPGVERRMPCHGTPAYGSGAGRALACQQAPTLAGMRQRIQTAVASVDRRTDAPRLHALTADAERFLAVQAQQHVSLERELVQLRALVTDMHQAPAALTQRVQRLESVVEVLEDDLAAARPGVATLTQEQA